MHRRLLGKPLLYLIAKTFKVCSDYKSLKCYRDKFNGAGRALVSSFKNMIERIKALETERRNLLLEIEELNRMADAKAKALESGINMLPDEVKSLRNLLSGEDLEVDSRTKKKK